MSLPCDWQTSKQKLSERGQHLLETGQWSDCNFIVGQEPQQQTLKGHKLFLAMSSPVFEAMFFGGMAEKNDPIPIRDVQPEAFKALLEYIYTDKVELGSFELACELCYCAKKYMLPSLVEECTKYLWCDLSPKKACRAYEFAKLFEEPVLMEKCLQIIRTKTDQVLKEASWEDVELGTLLKVLEQDDLQISSEIELFTAMERWAKSECSRKSLDSTNEKCLKSVIGNALLKIRFLSLTPQEFAEGPGLSPLLTKDEAFAILMNILCTGNKTMPMPEGFCMNSNSRTTKPVKTHSNLGHSMGVFPVINMMTSRHIFPPYGNLNIPVRSGFLNDGESSSSTMRNTSPILVDASINKDSGNLPNTSSTGVVVREGPKYYCLRSVVQQTDCLNTNVLDCSVTFSVDKNICVVGVQVPTQIAAASNFTHAIDADSSYTEILYAHLLDCDGTRLTYTHFTTKANFGTLVEITFNRPVYIQKHKVYRVGVVFNKAGWYPVGVCAQNMSCDSVFFSFGVGNTAHAVRDGLIRSIVFTYH
ncbi:BTB/POZ domain-containing protein 2 [Trachymyrmex septentrionalis]|uniref:BTB/POZ domain-containing protein 2 n=1 Tax=Trachymyrmex septentrionalis TaxID=34720 RepID=A0A195F3I2_9HYME|nr:PREDICTED: BTB/POZ domain-containing protein 2-like isoform X1 [Trachymyrmex septentrionalis]XP_018348996.1 PREDICTED: BTB/POZ domain-containing protein 2-like isoform X1 [Trachymyrmex septentrionalis]KYN34644.1 BTB/POZ domain-containing protein 2 [Trachymyrmex septentrionalis]